MFCEDTSVTALADYWIDNKFSGLLDNLNKLSRLERKSYIYILQKAYHVLCKYYLGNTQDPVYIELTRPGWLKPKNADSDILKKNFPPPFLEKSIKFYPSKFDHIVAIYTGLNQYKIVNKLRKTNMIYPFYSQPLVEFVLSIPIYEMYNAEYTRIIFRDSLKNLFNSNMFYRRYKGDTTAILQLAVEQNEQRIHELCLEGFMARQGEIDRKELEQDIKKIKFGKLDGLRNLFHLLAIELWLEEWEI
ncbi:MAG: hypothetical protein LBG48_04740 [Rickettsiales bacterium]|jgi:hypothetical protein|nr:hypothetical protein [Rickettsiales bacterium]